MSKFVKISNLKKTLRYLKKNGIRPTYYAMKERMETGAGDGYTYVPPTAEALKEQEKRAAHMKVRFSILVPAYETREEHLRAMIDSVLAQSYGNFELIISDASSSDKVEKVIETYTAGGLNIEKKGRTPVFPPIPARRWPMPRGTMPVFWTMTMCLQGTPSTRWRPALKNMKRKAFRLSFCILTRINATAGRNAIMR